MIIKNVRFDWLFVWDTNKQDKYSVCVIMENNHPQMKEVEAAIEKARLKGVAIGKFSEAQTKSAAFKKNLRNGTEEFEAEERPAHYKGTMFFNASNGDQPGIVGPDTKPILDTSQYYSGCYGHVNVAFFPFNNESKGIGAGLNNIMFTKADDRLDGRQTADEAFAGLEIAKDGKLT